MKTFWMLWLACLACGCSVIRQHATTEGQGTNLVRVTSLTVKTLGDAKQVIESLRASNGATHSLGASGVQQESTSEVVQNLVQLAVMAARASSGLPPVPPAAIPQAPAAAASSGRAETGPPANALAPVVPTQQRPASPR